MFEDHEDSSMRDFPYTDSTMLFFGDLLYKVKGFGPLICFSFVDPKCFRVFLENSTHNWIFQVSAILRQLAGTEGCFVLF